MRCNGNMGRMLLMKLIINRLDEWFNTEFPEYDHYFVCMKLLEKLSTNPKRGVEYDKLTLIKLVSPSGNQEMMIALDKAIIYLTARGLVEKRKISDFKCNLYITTLGLEAYNKFKEVLNETD